MSRVAVVVLALLGGCTLYFEDSPDRPPPWPEPAPFDAGSASPDAFGTAQCGYVGCGEGRHCENQCAPPGTAGCPIQCHVTCVPDTPCSDVDCGPGKSCVSSCLHDCDAFAWICHQRCEPNGDPGSCTGSITCNAEPPACRVGTTPGRANGCYTGYCIPQNECTDLDPGGCDARLATCTDAPPVCPADTVPGVTDGCWSGFCIPVSACACETLGTEDTCTSRPDCVPIYDGAGCSCATNTCTCADPDATFDRCRAL